jgi:hypothetical protein
VQPRSGESLVLYDSRLTDSYQFPLDLGPLNDVKCAYVEVANPFISDRLMSITRALPEHLRTERRGFTAVVDGLGPPIPAAKRSSLASLASALRSNSFTDAMLAELQSTDAERVCDRRALDLVVDGLRRRQPDSARHRLRGTARAILPERLRMAVNPEPKSRLALPRLAFRLYIASRMAGMLIAYAAAASHVWQSEAQGPGAPPCPG